jgi:diguanylate cyclase (GGDEF)-like protein
MAYVLKFPCLRSLALITICLLLTTQASANDLSLDEGLQRIQDSPETVVAEYSNILQTLNEDASSNQTNIAIAHLVISSWHYDKFLAKKAHYHAKEALHSIQHKPNSLLYNQVLVVYAKALELDGQAETAKPMAERAVQWASANADSVLLQEAYIALGLCDLTLGKYGDSLQSFTLAYELAKAAPNPSRTTGELAYYLGMVYEYTDNLPVAISFFQEALDYSRGTDNQISYSDTLYGLAKAYKTNGQADKALPLFQESLKISIEFDDAQGQAYTHKELAGIYLENGNDLQAHRSLVKALLLFSESKNSFMLANVNEKLADFAYAQNEIPQALEMADIALEYVQGDSHKPAFISLHFLKAKLFSRIGDFEKAYDSLMLTYEEKIKFDQQRNNEKYERLRAEFELNQKEDENKLLVSQNTLANENAKNKDQQNLVFKLLLVLLACVALAVLFLYQQSKKAQKQLKVLASTDSLTKLANRRTAFNNLATQLKLANREHYELSVALVDLDHFKNINDELGHPIGDRVLSLFAQLAMEQFRSTDMIARIGGEEFLFIFPFTNIEQAQLLIIDFTDTVKEDPELRNLIKRTLTCSVGVVDATKYDDELSTISAADKMMYEAKKFGRDAIMIDAFNNTD